jgi:hypothetical protein
MLSSPTLRSPSIRQPRMSQAAPSSRVSSAQDDPGNCVNKLQLRWKMLRNHRDTDLYWFFEDDPASLHKNSGIITAGYCSFRLLFLLVDLDIQTPPGVKWTGHSEGNEQFQGTSRFCSLTPRFSDQNIRIYLMQKSINRTYTSSVQSHQSHASIDYIHLS